MARRSVRDPQGVKLTPADAFDLIRWLARSQSDPRKAVAELVQNAIDANARTITIERRRRGRRATLVLRDDGEGIRPSEDRESALRYIATHIGRSHKRNLSPAERHAEIIAGQYGIGLLGFWSIGRRMEIRSRVASSPVWLLRLIEDEPRAEVVQGPPTIDEAATFTEVVVSELHQAALRPLAVRRLAEYLGAELRGPLLASGVAIEVREFDVRGQVVDRVTVTPRRFEGLRLDVPTQLAVPGYGPIIVELYTGATGSVELTCAGTVVADRIADLGALGLDAEPWSAPGLSGTIEFAAFMVPPGSRRGVIPNAASDAFVAALAQLAPQVQATLDRQLHQRHAASERQLMLELRRALRGLRERLPHLELPAGRGGRGGAGTDRDRDPLGTGAAIPLDPSEPSGTDAPAAPVSDEAEGTSPDEPEIPPTLLPPGPANHVRIAPEPIRLWPGGARRVRAIVTDLHGQQIRAETIWTSSSPLLAIEGSGQARTVQLGELAEPGVYTITVIAQANGGAASCTTELVFIDGPMAGGTGAGIPEPTLVEEPGQSWRSRLSAERWHVNIGHPDFRALAAEPRARLRYLVALFAKDLTLSGTHPANEPVLEQMIEVIVHAERNMLRTTGR